MIATEYAKTIFDVHPNLDTCMDEFNALISVYDDLLTLMQSPNINKDAKHEILKNTLKGFTDDFIYFLYVVVDNNRFMEMKNIQIEFKKMYYKKNGIALVDVYTSNILTDDEKKSIISFLMMKLNMKIELNEIIDKNNDGIKLIYNGNVIDYTIEKRMNDMHFSL